MKVLCLLFISWVGCAYAGNLPSFITPCSKSDPQVNQCIQKVIHNGGPQFTEGIPDLGIAPLDPVKLGTVQVDNPALKITFTDTVVTGLKRFNLNHYKINFEKNKASLDFTANVTLKAHYEMDGRVLILPIKGSGPCKIKITNLNILIQYNFKEVDDHWIVTDYTDQYKMSRAQFKFSNLFGGNQQLAGMTEKFTNENWQIIMNEIAPPALEQIIKKCVDVVKTLFASVPVSQLTRS